MEKDKRTRSHDQKHDSQRKAQNLERSRPPLCWVDPPESSHHLWEDTAKRILPGGLKDLQP
jgi:hypothetical protein